MLIARSLTMAYPGVQALSGVDFELRAGEIHALCGENGAGKSTLIKILSGILPLGRFGGSVSMEGSPCRFSGPGDALRAGIRVIHQELALCPDFSVAANLYLGAEPRRMALAGLGILDEKRMEAGARVALNTLGLKDLDPRTRTGSLPVGVRQAIEIARALRAPEPGEPGRRARVLILDEPTSALTSREAARLEETLLRLRVEGLAILYISHRLDEVFRLADRITVLRNGESSGTLPRDAFDTERIVEWMVGRPLQAIEPAREPISALGESKPSRTGEPLLSVRRWTVPSTENPAKLAVDEVSFDLFAGEILGVCGLMGAGRTELVESLCGLTPRRGQGEVFIEGRPYSPRDARHAHANGLALVCEDRRANGLMRDKSVRANTTYASLKQFCSAGWLVNEARENEAAAKQTAALHVKTPNLEFPAGNLSGGNQQKVLIGRALLTRPKILILDEPTRGIDVGAKEEIYALIRRLAAEGMGILVISSESGEARRLSDRLLILRTGKVAGEKIARETDDAEILSLASGGTTETPE